jgi:hypothetical protein
MADIGENYDLTLTFLKITVPNQHFQRTSV